MATQTQYYNLDKPSYDEVADIEVINANMDKIDQQMRNNADGVNFAKGISSDAYDNSKLYAVGDYCIYDNKLYRCITAIESAEAFNIAKWEQTTVGREVKQLNSNLSELSYGDASGNKNLFGGLNFAKSLKNASANSVINETDKTVTFDHNGTNGVIYSNFKANTRYTFFLKGKTIESGTNNSMEITYTDDSVTRISFSNTEVVNKIVSDNGKSVKNLKLSWYNANQTILYYDYCGVFEGAVTESDFEPYIPSVKMLAEEVNQQNESLEWQGLTNVFDGQLQNGAYSESSGSFVSLINNVCSVNKIKCKAGDMFSIKCDETLNTIYAFFYSDSAFISFTKITNTNELKTIAPNGTTYAYIRLERDNYDINNVGEVYVYINNSIEQIKNDLSPKKIELQNVDERVTIQDNGSFIINGFAFVNLLVTFNETLQQWSNFVRLPRPKGGNFTVYCENSVRLTIYSQDNLPGDCGTYETVASGTEIRLLVNYEVA